MENQFCIFCKIIAREVPSSIIDETADIIVIKDIRPKASTHYLIIPKKHILDIQSFDQKEDYVLAANIIMMAKKLSSQLPDVRSFRLVSNNGADAGQVVFHSHFHFLAGNRMPDF